MEKDIMENPNYEPYFKAIAKQLEVIYKQCYPPIRELKELRYYDKETTQIANCLEHAVFNFSDETLAWFKEKYGENVYKFWANFSSMGYVFDKEPKQQLEDVTPEIIERIKATGLKVEECSLDAKPEEGQWKIAYYFNLCDEPKQFISDFHFFRQEPDGKWSTKIGKCSIVQYFDELPKLFRGGYKLQKIYMITNPHIYRAKDAEND